MKRIISLLISMLASCYGEYDIHSYGHLVMGLGTVSWEVAKEMCYLRGFELFYPHNLLELQNAKSFIADSRVGYVYIGITSRGNNGVFKTIDGRDAGEVNMLWGKPNNSVGNDECVVLGIDGTYQIVPCSHRYAYICIRPRKTNNVSTVSELKVKAFFRNDYTYLEYKKSFYKAHPVPRHWESARWKCIMEGATLFYPEDEVEVRKVIRYLNETQPWFQYMFVGVSTRLASGVYMTVDGQPIRNVYNEWYRSAPSGANGRNSCVTLSREGFFNDIKCTDERPFVCKKTAASIEWSTDCTTPHKGYMYNANTGNCYKFHLQQLNWREALEACDAEQAQLAIINTAEEVNYLKNISNNINKEAVPGWNMCPYVHLGYYFDTIENDWRTIKGESLEKAGYNVWDDYQVEGEGERCGAMLYNGRLNDVSCEEEKCFFVCEIDKKNISFNVTANIRSN